MFRIVTNVTNVSDFRSQTVPAATMTLTFSSSYKSLQLSSTPTTHNNAHFAFPQSEADVCNVIIQSAQLNEVTYHMHILQV